MWRGVLWQGVEGVTTAQAMVPASPFRMAREDSVDGTLSPVSLHGQGMDTLDNDTTGRRKVGVPPYHHYTIYRMPPYCHSAIQLYSPSPYHITLKYQQSTHPPKDNEYKKSQALPFAGQGQI